MKKDYAIYAIIALVLVIFGIVLVKNKGESNSASNEKSIPVQVTDSQKTKSANKGVPSMMIDTKKTYTATLKTDKGDIEILLDAQKTPITVNNFVVLSRKKFYDNTVFHRIIKGFMIQGGDPNGNGTGGPGYSFNDESIDGEYDRGTVAMANSGPNTNGSQFFIMHQKTNLPKNYVIFGHVIKGLEVVDAIATGAVQMSTSGENSQPVNPTVVKTVEILEK